MWLGPVQPRVTALPPRLFEKVRRMLCKRCFHQFGTADVCCRLARLRSGITGRVQPQQRNTVEPADVSPVETKETEEADNDVLPESIASVVKASMSTGLSRSVQTKILARYICVSLSSSSTRVLPHRR